MGGTVLPGLVKSVEVTETAKVDEQEAEGSAFKPKQAVGYEAAKVNIELIIDEAEAQTKYERYAVLRAVFQTPGQSVLQPILIIVCEDTAAHGVDKVIFKKLTHKGESKKSQLTANLELWEYILSGSGSSGSAGETASTGTVQAPAASSDLSADYQTYLRTKRGKSPAVDDADITAAVGKIAALPY